MKEMCVSERMAFLLQILHTEVGVGNREIENTNIGNRFRLTAG